MLTTVAKNAMLDGLTIADVSAHTAYSASGANEVTGGTYVRKAITFAAASSGARAASSTPTLDIPAGTTVRFLGLWGQGSPSQLIGMFALGGAEKEMISVVLGSPGGRLRVPAHGYSNGDKVVFYGGTPPAPLVEGTVYYVVGAATDDFEVAATAGGASIPLTDYPDGECKVSKIVEEAYGAAGTLQVSSGSLTVGA